MTASASHPLAGGSERPPPWLVRGRRPSAAVGRGAEATRRGDPPRGVDAEWPGRRHVGAPPLHHDPVLLQPLGQATRHLAHVGRMPERGVAGAVGEELRPRTVQVGLRYVDLDALAGAWVAPEDKLPRAADRPGPRRQKAPGLPYRSSMQEGNMQPAPDEVFSVTLPSRDVPPAGAPTAGRLGRALDTAPHGIAAEADPCPRPPRREGATAP